VYVTVPSYDTIAISLLEAMACAAAPVASNLASTRECIKDGVNGYLVPVRDVDATAQSIILLLHDEDQRKRFTEYNRSLVKERFDWDKNMRKVESMYYRLREQAHRYKKENVPRGESGGHHA
jgi:glycosyltransferase involved in cell wall biosynthesis